MQLRLAVHQLQAKLQCKWMQTRRAIIWVVQGVSFGGVRRLVSSKLTP